MAVKTYVGVNQVARNVKSIYVGVSGTARKVSKVYIGINEIAKLCYSAAPQTYNISFSGNGFAGGPSVIIDSVEYYNGKNQPETVSVNAGDVIILKIAGSMSTSTIIVNGETVLSTKNGGTYNLAVNSNYNITFSKTSTQNSVTAVSAL